MGAPGKPIIEIPADYLTYEEAAQVLGIQVGSLKTAVYAGKLTALRVQGTNRKFISRAEVESYHSRKGAREMIRASAPLLPGEEEAARLAALKDVINASSAPMLDGWKSTVQGLTQIAVAAIMSGGALIDPKHIAG